MFRLSWAELPAIETEYESLWRFARALQRADLSIDGWHPRASSVKASLRIALSIAPDLPLPRSRCRRPKSRSIREWARSVPGMALICTES